jgi:hypothetical protein
MSGSSIEPVRHGGPDFRFLGQFPNREAPGATGHVEGGGAGEGQGAAVRTVSHPGRPSTTRSTAREALGTW